MDNIEEIKNRLKELYKSISYTKSRKIICDILDEVNNDDLINKLILEISSDVEQYSTILREYFFETNRKIDIQKYPNIKDIKNICHFYSFISNRCNFDKELFYELFKESFINNLIKESYRYYDLDEEMKKILQEKLDLKELLKKSNSSGEKYNILLLYEDIQKSNNKDIDINSFIDDLPLEAKFSLISSMDKKDDFNKVIKPLINKIGLIQDEELYKKIVDKIIEFSNKDNKELFLNIIDTKLIKKYDMGDFFNFYEKVKKYTTDEGTIKIINEKEDSYIIKNVYEYIQKNNIDYASYEFEKINNKLKYKNYYLYLLNNKRLIDFSNWKTFYVREDDELTQKFINIARNASFASDSFFKKLVEDGKKDLAIQVAGFDKKIDPLEYGAIYIEKMLLLKQYDMTNEYIEQLYNNYNKLKEQNNGINYHELKFLIGLIGNEILDNFSPRFVCDVLEYGKTTTFLKNSKELYGLEQFLIDNNIYSKKNIHFILEKYDKNRGLLKDLLNNNIKLSKEEVDNFKKYISCYNQDITITTYLQLQKFNDIIKDVFEKSNDKEELKKYIYYALFGYVDAEIKELLYNPYLQNEMVKEGLLDVYDFGLLSVIKDIEEISKENDSIEEIKNKYRNIIDDNISLYTIKSNLYKKYKNYFQKQLLNENLMDNLIKEKEKNINKDDIIKYKDKEIETIHLEGENFQFLIHCLGYFSEFKILNANMILNNPEIWNGFDYKSTISTSLINNNHCLYLDGRIGLGFYKLPPDSLLSISNTDAQTETYNYGVYEPLSKHRIPLTSSSRLLKFSNEWKIESYFEKDKKLPKGFKYPEFPYNEVALYRKNSNLKEFDGRLQPDFIFVDNFIDEKAKRLAYYFNKPIVILHTDIYEKKYKENVNKYKNRIMDNFSIDDVKNILETKEFSEDESVNIIMDYIDKLEINEDKFNEFIENVKQILIKYYITDVEKIEEVLNILNQHYTKKMQEEFAHEYR